MRKELRIAAAAVALSVLLFSPSRVEAQAEGRRSAVAQPTDTLSLRAKSRIREFYASHPVSNAEALPPGIRKNLARGKPLPPGIAKKTAPQELRAGLSLPDGYELVEVGVDVLLVEVATNLIHDVLSEVLRR